MKKVKNFLGQFLSGSLITIICFQLLTMPIAFGYDCPKDDNDNITNPSCGYDSTDDAEDIAARKSCLSESGKCWICSSGRCMTDAASLAKQENIKAEFTANVDNCEAMEDAADRRQCYETSGICQTVTDATKKANCEAAQADCDGMTDSNLKRDCYSKLKQEYGLGQGEYDFWDGLAQTAEGLAVGIAVANYVATKKLFPGFAPGCATLTFYNVAAVATIAAELYYYFMLKGDLDELKTAYVNNEDPFAAQLDAFTYLKDEQEVLQEVLKQKAIINTALSALYLIAAVSGYVEFFTPSPPAGVGGQVCPAVGNNSIPSSRDQIQELLQKNPTNMAISAPIIEDDASAVDSLANLVDWNNFLQGAKQSLSLTEYSRYHEFQFFSDFTPEEKKEFSLGTKSLMNLQTFGIASAYATDPTASATVFHEESIFENGLYIAIITGSAAVVGAILPLIKGMETFFSNNLTLAILSTAAAASMGILAGIYYSEMSQISENISMLDEMILEFERSMSDYCSEDDRNDQSNVKCYCYNEDGTRKVEERANSNICQKLWNPRKANFAKGNDTNGGSKNSKSGCMTINREFDQRCKCRLFKDSATGNNACFKVNTSAINLGGIGTALNAPALINGANSMAQGDHGEGPFGNSNQASNLAAKAKKLVKKFRDDADKKLKKSNSGSIKSLEGALRKVSSQADSPQYRSMMAISDPMNMAQAAQDAAGNSAAIQKALSKSGLKKALYKQKKKKRGKKKMAFNFDLENESAKNAPKVQGGFGDKKYRIEHKDIVKNESVSIWKVISNRYNQTGLRVLFED